MFRARCGRNADAGDVNFRRIARRGIQLPNGEIALEDDCFAVGGNRGPQHAAILELSDLARRAGGAGGTHPNVLRVDAIGNVINFFAVGTPHGPHLFCAGICQGFVSWRSRGIVDEIDFAFVEMAVAFAPPLGRAGAARGDRENFSIRRGRREKFIRITIGSDRHGSAALNADAINVVHAGNIVARRLEIDPAAIMRPACGLLVRVVIGEPAEIPGGESEDVDIAISRSSGRKRELATVWRKERTRFDRRMGDEQVRFAAGRRYGPNIAAGNEGDLFAVGRDAGLGKCGRARLIGGGVAQIAAQTGTLRLAQRSRTRKLEVEFSAEYDEAASVSPCSRARKLHSASRENCCD